MKYPTTDRLRALLDYNPETGVFTWRWRPRYDFKSRSLWGQHNTQNAGKRAGYLSTHGYRYIKIDGELISEQRLAWLYYYGVLPEQADHENGITDDNRIENLRSVDHVGNARNQKIRSTNTSGATGVRRDYKNPNIWVAYIYVNYKCIHVGRFGTFDEAVSARKAAEVKYGFHPNHGRAA